MDFDPDAYLAKTKQGFDPDAYLAAIDTTATPKASRAWSDVPLEAVKNFPSSAGHLIAEQAKLAANIAQYAIPKVLQHGLAAPAAMAIEGGKALYQDPDLVRKIPAAVLQSLADEYGSEEALKKTIATDPAKVLMDASILVSGGRAAVSRTGRAIGDIGRAADVSRPFHEIPRRPEPPPQLPPPVPTEAELAQQQLAAAGTPVNIPRALTTQNRMIQSGSVALSKAPVIGTPLDEAVRAVPAQMGAGVEALAQRHGPALPENIIGGGIDQTLTSAAAREASAAKAAAEADHAARLKTWETENTAREAAINAQREQAEAAAHQQFGNVHPNQMAENAARAVQERHARQSGENQANWRAIESVDAHANKKAFDDLHSNIETGLSEEGFTLDPVRTPNAWGMMQDMRRLSGQAPAGDITGIPPRMIQALEASYGKGQIPPHVLEDLVPGSTASMTPGKDPNFRLMGRHAPEPGSPTVSVQGLDELRKRVGQMAYDATSPTDRRASNAIKSQFDDFLNDTLEKHLVPGGDPNARAVIQTAIDSHRDLTERFGYNTKRLRGENKAAARDLNLIVTGDLGPEAIARNILGSGKPGTRPGSAPLHDVIMNAVENPAALRTDMRGAYWNALTEGQTPRAIGSNIGELPNTRMGRTLFDPHEHEAMGRYATIRQQHPEALKAAEAEAKRTAPKLATVEPGKAEQLAKQAIGRSEERTLGAFDSALREGGDIKQAARIWGRMTETNRSEFRANFLRNLGGGGEEFSAAKFIKNWESYTPQAKAIVLDREHRNTINAIHTLAKEYGATLSRYGNPSGTAQVSAWHKLMTGGAKTAAATVAGTVSFYHPIGMAFAGLGGYGVAKLLAKPQGARQLTRWAGMTKAYNSAPSTTKLIALQNATRLLARSAGDKK